MLKPAPAAPAALASGNPVGYVLQIDGGPTIYHTGDTDVFTDMKLIAEFFKVDLMLSSIGGAFTMRHLPAAFRYAGTVQGRARQARRPRRAHDRDEAGRDAELLN